MKVEIKEILDILNRMAKENKESDNPLQATVILFEILYKVLDYITNLQDKVEWYENIEANKTIDKFRLEHNKEIKMLQEENERLKELIDCDNEEYDIQEMIINQQKSELLEKEDYKSRIERATNYIKVQQKIFRDYDIVSENQLKNLLEILQGDGKDE